MFKSALKLLRDTGKIFVLHRDFERAAALSFYALVALIPIVMIMSSLLGFVLGSSAQAAQAFTADLMRIFPVGRELFVANIDQLLDHRSSLSFYGTLLLFVIANTLLGNLERALSRIFGDKRRTLISAHLLGMLFVSVLALLLVLPSFVALLHVVLMKYGFDIPLYFVRSHLYSFICAFVGYFLLIRMIPKTRVAKRHAAFGGLVFAVALSLMHVVSRFYFSVVFTRYNLIYGSLSSLVLMLVWMYYFFALVLFVSEMVALLRQKSLQIPAVI